MPPYTRHMTQTATYWAPGVPDGYGGLSFASVTPVLISCRWEDKQELFRDASAREFVSQSIVYTAQDVQPQGYMALGDVIDTAEDDPRNIPGADEIRAVMRSPDLRGQLTLHKVVL